jgi:hypothetical protein
MDKENVEYIHGGVLFNHKEDWKITLIKNQIKK